MVHRFRSRISNDETTHLLSRRVSSMVILFCFTCISCFYTIQSWRQLRKTEDRRSFVEHALSRGCQYYVGITCTSLEPLERRDV